MIYKANNFYYAMKQKGIKIAYWIITILFAGFMLFSAISELMQTGAAKILGVFAILMPKFRVLKEWAYAGFTFDIVGASASMLLAGLGIGPTLFTLVFLIPLFLSYFFWKKLHK